MDPVTLSFLVDAARQAPSADNIQPWHLTWDGRVLSVRFDTARVTGKSFSADDHATLLGMGAVAENLVQAALAAMLEPQLAWYPSDESGHGYARVVVTSKRPIGIPEEARRAPLFLRHTNRTPFRTEPLPQALTEQVSTLTEGGARIQAYAKPAKRNDIARLVEVCARVRFRTRELHEWLMSSLRFGSDALRGDGLDVAALGLPPGGRLLLRFIRDWATMRRLNSLGFHRLMASIDASPLRLAPTLVAVVGPHGRIGSLDSGRLMERAWIELNRQGFAVQPYYVIADQINRFSLGRIPTPLVPQIESVARELPAVFDLRDGETLQMLLRVGRPKRQPVLSKRLPAERVFTDLTSIQPRG